MNEVLAAALIVLAYKLCSHIVGLLFAFMGFRLFQSKVTRKGGDLAAIVEGNSLTLRNAAPGTFFAVVGSLIVLTSIFRGFDFESVLANDFKNGKSSTVQSGTVDDRRPVAAVVTNGGMTVPVVKRTKVMGIVSQPFLPSELVSDDDIMRRIVNVLAEQCGKDAASIKGETRLPMDLEFDDLDWLELSSALGEEFQVEIDSEAIRRCSTVKELNSFVASRMRIPIKVLP